MKQRIKLSGNPDPKFQGVGRTIAGGPPPKWLMRGLGHFSDHLGAVAITTGEAKRFNAMFSRMSDAADRLIKGLPLFENLRLGLQCPDDVAIALDVLPRIKKTLALLAKPSGKKRPNVLRVTCAAVVVEAWRLSRGKAEPRSDQLYRACEEYWKACGGEPIGPKGDIGNWRRHVEVAVVVEDRLVRMILSNYKAAYEREAVHN